MVISLAYFPGPGIYFRLCIFLCTLDRRAPPPFLLNDVFSNDAGLTYMPGEMLDFSKLSNRWQLEPKAWTVLDLYMIPSNVDGIDPIEHLDPASCILPLKIFPLCIIPFCLILTAPCS